MLALEFLLAAGLLRLGALDDYTALGIVAAVVVVRRLISVGLEYAVRDVGGNRIGNAR